MQSDTNKPSLIPRGNPLQPGSPDRELFVFRAGPHWLGVWSTQVREVFRLGHVTPLPRAPSFVCGVSAHRGEVFPVIDLLKFLAQSDAASGRRYAMVGSTAQLTCAWLADDVAGLHRVKQGAVLAPPAHGEVAAEFVSGLTPVRELKTSAVVIDLPRVLQVARQKVGIR